MNDKPMNDKPECKYLARDGVCGGNLDVCCIYQTGHNNGQELRSLRETWCNYPTEMADLPYKRAIVELAGLVDRLEEEVRTEYGGTV